MLVFTVGRMPVITMASSSADDEHEHSELVLFKVNDACVYQVPPASTIGHRAEMWDVDNWLQVRPGPPLAPQADAPRSPSQPQAPRPSQQLAEVSV